MAIARYSQRNIILQSRKNPPWKLGGRDKFGLIPPYLCTVIAFSSLEPETLIGRKCLVLMPIGKPGSATRRKSDALLEQVLVPALKSQGIEVRRGDDIGATWISPKLIDAILMSDLIVAVLNDLNPNVFYEMGVAQAWCKPLIAFAEETLELPFDVKDLNTVRHGSFGADGRLPEASAVAAQKDIADRVMPAIAAARSEPTAYCQGISKIGSQFALKAIYSGKRFILEVFESSVSDILKALNGDYELAEGKPEGLRGLAPGIAAASEQFHQQCKALEKAVRVAEVPLPQELKNHCLQICDRMTEMLGDAMKLADRLKRKEKLESSDVLLARKTLTDLVAKTNICIESVRRY